jgi:hypothetical protein
VHEEEFGDCGVPVAVAEGEAAGVTLGRGVGVALGLPRMTDPVGCGEGKFEIGGLGFVTGTST